jgi:hypothetical protein
MYQLVPLGRMADAESSPDHHHAYLLFQRNTLHHRKSLISNLFEGYLQRAAYNIVQ